MTRYSREDALSERQLELLLRGARSLGEPKAFEATLIINCAAKIGLRVGEIAHLRSEWINWHDRLIEIPAYDACEMGKDGGVCGYCRNRARDYQRTHNTTVEAELEALQEEFGDAVDEAALREQAEDRVAEQNVSFEDALEMRWTPKTSTAERAVPFDHDVRVQLCVEEFDERFDRFPKSVATINRRVDQAAAAAGIESNVYPHALRATAATIHASHAVSPHALMGIMGWADMSTARSYISASEESAARELRSKHH